MQAGGPPSCTTADRSAGTQATTLAAGYHWCCGMGPVRCTTAQKSATPMQAVHHSLQQHARVYCAVQQRHTQTHAAERETQAQTHSPQHCTHTDTHRGCWHTRATGTPVTSRGRTKTRTRNNTAAAALRSSLVSHSCPAIGTFSLPRHIYIYIYRTPLCSSRTPATRLLHLLQQPRHVLKTAQQRRQHKEPPAPWSCGTKSHPHHPSLSDMYGWYPRPATC
jgi:hypothetical protein